MDKKKIGFDLDGVLIDKPPLIPRWLLHRLFKGSRQKFDYHCPACGWNRLIRIWSHHPWLRPPINENINFLKELARDKEVEIYLISSRYSFLKKATQRILRRRGINHCFVRAVINDNNQSPLLFKEEVLTRFGIEVYFEDDPEVVEYLRKRLPETKIGQVSRRFSCRDYWESLG